MRPPPGKSPRVEATLVSALIVTVATGPTVTTVVTRVRSAAFAVTVMSVSARPKTRPKTWTEARAKTAASEARAKATVPESAPAEAGTSGCFVVPKFACDCLE